MKTVITILAASAVLSASLCAGLAATGGASGERMQVAAAAMPKAEAPAPRSAWIDPAPKADTSCRDAAWPYRGTLCAAKAGTSEAPARKVRVISTAAPAQR